MQHHLVESYGYHRENDGQLSIQWITIPSVPNDVSLIKCFKCTGVCQRCRCAKNKLPCAPFCHMMRFPVFLENRLCARVLGIGDIGGIGGIGDIGDITYV